MSDEYLLPDDKWIEVDLEAINHNVRQIQGQIGSGTRLIAVVKANAYGLGAVAVCRQLISQGIDFLAVTFLEEALLLRENGIHTDILVFSPLSETDYGVAINQDLIVTVASLQDFSAVLRVVEQVGSQARIHLKVDTGMGRFGLMDEEVLGVAGEAFVHNKVRLEGIYTHFAAPADSDYTLQQFRAFEGLLHILEERGIKVPCRHCCGSSAFLRYPFMHLDAVRIGTLLGGQYPGGKVNSLVKLQDAYRFKARITSIRRLSKGSYLGYFRTYRLKRDACIVTIPVGLVDGWGVDTLPKPTGWADMIKMIIKIIAAYFNLKFVIPQVTINNQSAYIRGKIFMQFCLVEIPESMQVTATDVVEVPVKRTLASPAVRRIYRQDRQVISRE